MTPIILAAGGGLLVYGAKWWRRQKALMRCQAGRHDWTDGSTDDYGLSDADALGRSVARALGDREKRCRTCGTYWLRPEPRDDVRVIGEWGDHHLRVWPSRMTRLPERRQPVEIAEPFRRRA